MMWEVAYADGKLDPDEDVLLRRVAGLIYVSDEDRIAARQRVLSRIGKTATLRADRMGQPVKVIVKIIARPDAAAAMRAVVLNLAAESREEEGCISYDVLQNSGRASRFPADRRVDEQRGPRCAQSDAACP